MKKFNRRTFIKTGAVATAATIVNRVHGENVPSGRREANIVTRKFGSTGLTLPVVSMGVMRADNPSLVKAALDNGIVMFDTANGYQGGRNELMLGEVFKDYPRDSYVVATKVKPSGVSNRGGLPSSDTTAEDFLKNFNISMERLKLDYVDILYVHSVSSAELVKHPPIVKAISGLKKEGRVKYIGISTHSSEPEVINAMVDAGIWDVVLTRYNFTLSYINELNTAIDRAAKAGMAVVAMKTMAGGYLDRERTKPVNTKAALKWALLNPNIHTSIPGMTSFDMLDSNLEVLSDITLTDQEKKDIMIASNETGLFCSTCNKCLDTCLNKLPVPDLMRAYMYAYGYASNEKAYTLLSDLGTGTNPCGDCNDCNIDCTKGFNVREKIADISRLAAVPQDFII